MILLRAGLFALLTMMTCELAWIGLELRPMIVRGAEGPEGPPGPTGIGLPGPQGIPGTPAL